MARAVSDAQGTKAMKEATVAELEAELEARRKTPPAAAPSALAELIHPGAPGFKEKATPKSAADLLLFHCPCGGAHYRHAGYVEMFLPFLKPDGRKELELMQRHVMVCVKCRKAFVWTDQQMYEVTDKIDLEAWEKAEVELHKATGPGGQC